MELPIFLFVLQLSGHCSPPVLLTQRLFPVCITDPETVSKHLVAKKRTRFENKFQMFEFHLAHDHEGLLDMQT